MSPLVLHTESGKREIPDSYLLVGIDETGHELFADRKHRLFGLGGCAVPVHAFEQDLAAPWQELRHVHFPQYRGPFHAADLRNLSPTQMEALGAFFRASRFGRIASVVTDRAALEPDLPPYKIVARQVLDAVARLVGRFGCDGVAMIIEESRRTDALAAAFFSGYSIQYRTESGPLPFYKGRMAKSAAMPLLEVADSVIHVAGGQVRDHLSGKEWGRRRDFQAVFRIEPDPLVEFQEIIEARYSPPRA